MNNYIHILYLYSMINWTHTINDIKAGLS